MNQSLQRVLNIVITGGNAGIGFETAKALCALGHNVIFGSRNIQKNKQAVQKIKQHSQGRGTIKSYILDLSKRRSIEIFAEQIKLNFKHIDQLINNAGVMLYNKSISQINMEMTMTVNYFGHFYLTFLLFDLIREAQQARIINVTGEIYKLYKWNPTNYYQSIIQDQKGSKKYDSLKAYALSKLAIIHFTRYLSKKLENCPNIKVICVHPGVVSTDFAHNYTKKNCLLRLAQYLLFYCCCCIFITPQKSASNMVYLCQIPFQNLSNGSFFDQQHEQKLDPYGLNEKQIRRLWKISEEAFNIKFQFEGEYQRQSSKSQTSIHI